VVVVLDEVVVLVVDVVEHSPHEMQNHWSHASCHPPAKLEHNIIIHSGVVVVVFVVVVVIVVIEVAFTPSVAGTVVLVLDV
jgi:xanthine/uracil permease